MFLSSTASFQEVSLLLSQAGAALLTPEQARQLYGHSVGVKIYPRDKHDLQGISDYVWGVPQTFKMARRGWASLVKVGAEMLDMNRLPDAYGFRVEIRVLGFSCILTARNAVIQSGLLNPYTLMTTLGYADNLGNVPIARIPMSTMGCPASHKAPAIHS